MERTLTRQEKLGGNLHSVEYLQTLNSPRWRFLKWRVIQRWHFQCARCGIQFPVRTQKQAMKHFHLHHLHYRTVGREGFSDVAPLCPECHAAIHGKPA